MNILFDLDYYNQGFYDKCTPEEKIVLENIWEYVDKKLMPLEREINQEELIQEPTKAIFIHIKDGMAIQAIGYSDSLTQKIIGSFNIEDGIVMGKIVGDALSRFLN